MFILEANKTLLKPIQRELITSGSVNVHRVLFEFSEEWAGLTRTAIFRAGTESRSVLLGDDNETVIPWEVLVKPHVHLSCGVYGTKNGDTVLPTIWADMGNIWHGAEPAGEPGQPGERGEQGPPGDPGVGIPEGGTAGQYLRKRSDADYDAEWADAPGGSGSALALRVTAPTGSIVTAEKDGNTYTASEQSGVWDIAVPECGTYTVRATRGDESAEVTAVTGPTPVNLAYGPQVFGVMWDSSNSITALTRLTENNDSNGYVNTNITEEPIAQIWTTQQGSSPFDNYMPWSGMEQYNIINGVAAYKRGQEGFSQTKYDTMVYIPEFWFCVKTDGTKWYWYISDKKRDGFEKHPGSGRYVGRYKTSGTGTTAGYASVSGKDVLSSVKRSDTRIGSMAKGAGWYEYDYATWCAVWLLYLVEFADWDSQKKIGRGWVDEHTDPDFIPCGLTDTINYHTGRPYGTDGHTAVQYRWIENPWGNVSEWVDGLNSYNRELYISLDNASFKDDTTNGYTSSGVTAPNPNGYIRNIGYSQKFPWAFLPNSTSGGSDSTYIPDTSYSSTGFRVLLCSGSRAHRSMAGLLFFNTMLDSSTGSETHTGRLILIPRK